MDNGESRFGTYLKELIKTAGMTQFQFYTKLGIKKPYFYDIVSGRVKPPPYPLQFVAVKILHIDEETKEKFFDIAAKEPGDMPADISKIIAEHPEAISRIRNDLKNYVIENQAGGGYENG